MADVALVDLPLLHTLQEVVSHVLRHVALLAEGTLAQLTLVGSFVLVHPSVVQETPGLRELFVTALVLSLDDLFPTPIFCDETEPESIAAENPTIALSTWVASFSLYRFGPFECSTLIR